MGNGTKILILKKHQHILPLLIPDKINCRTILWYLTFVGMAVNYMVRININMTVVVMVKQKLSAKSAIETAECLTKDQLLIAEKSWNSSTTTEFLNNYESLSTSPLNIGDKWNNESEILERITTTTSSIKVEKKKIMNGSIEKSLLRYFGVNLSLLFVCFCSRYFSCLINA